MPEEQGYLQRMKNGILSFSAYISLDYNCNRRFSQDSITTASYIWSFFDKDFPVLNSQGVCNGLVLDYARHTIKHSQEDSKSDPNYLGKLKRKFTLFGSSSQNFAKRIDQYQKKLQVSNNADAQYTKIAGGVNKFLDFIPRDSKVIGLIFNTPKSDTKGSGHVIAIHKIEQEGKISYKVFDPNFGEYNCADQDKLLKTLKNIDNYYRLDGLTGDCYAVNLENIVVKTGIIKGDDKYLDDKVAETIGGRTQYRSRDAQIEKLTNLINEKTPNIKEITKIIASVDLPEGFNLANKLSETFLTDFLKKENSLPNKTDREQPEVVSKRIANNLMKICKVENPTRRLAELITEGKATSIPHLVVELVKQGADLEGVGYQKIFIKYFNSGHNCAETAIYAIENNKHDLLMTLSQFCDKSGYNLLKSYSYNDKSLLKIAAEKNPDMALRMIHAGFTLHGEEMGGILKTTGAIIEKLALNKEEYKQIVLDEEFPKFLEEKKLKRTTPEQQQVFKDLYKAKIEENISGNRAEEDAVVTQINTKIAQIQVEQHSKSVAGWVSSLFHGSQKTKLPEQQALLGGDKENIPQNRDSHSKQSTARTSSSDEFDRLLAGVEASTRELLEETKKLGIPSKEARTRSISRSQDLPNNKKKSWLRNPFKARM